jgi:hypothetical protein
MKLTVDQPIKRERTKAANPFAEQAATLRDQTAEASMRITLEPADKTYQVIGWLREAANSVDKGLSVAFDPADDKDNATRKAARTFRFQFVKRVTRERKPKTEEAATATPAATTPAKSGAGSKRK